VTMADVLVCSTDPEEHRAVVEAVAAGCQSLRPRLVELRREGLRHFAFDDVVVDRRPVILLCHFCEGRTLLTDTDGLYNAFLLEALRVSDGQVFVGLSGLEKAAAGELAAEAVVDELVATGQTSVEALDVSRRLMTWDTTPSQFQLAHLDAWRSLPSLEPPPGLAAAKHPRRTKGLLCPLL